MSALRSPSLCSHNMKTQMHHSRVPHLWVKAQEVSQRRATESSQNLSHSCREKVHRGDVGMFPSVKHLPYPTDTPKSPCLSAPPGCPICICIRVNKNRFHCSFATTFPQLYDQRCRVQSITSIGTNPKCSGSPVPCALAPLPKEQLCADVVLVFQTVFLFCFPLKA